MAWRKLEDTFHSDRKIRKLARHLQIPEPHAAGHLVTLWSWALLHAKDGDLSKFDVDDIEHGAKWDGAHGDFLYGCVKSGLIDVETNEQNVKSYPGHVSGSNAKFVIHNWIERGGSYTEAMRKRLKNKDSANPSGSFQENPGTSRKIRLRREEKRREYIYMYTCGR
jgi:hypothetical protein